MDNDILALFKILIERYENSTVNVIRYEQDKRIINTRVIITDEEYKFMKKKIEEGVKNSDKN